MQVEEDLHLDEGRLSFGRKVWQEVLDTCIKWKYLEIIKNKIYGLDVLGLLG